MVGSKENLSKVGTSPYRTCNMELRSMSKRPPPYSNVDSLRLGNLYDDSTTKRKHGSNEVKLETGKDSPTMIIKNGCTNFPRCKYFMYCITGLLMFFTCVILMNVLFPYPLHASCVIKWKFGDPCIYTMQKFRCQILNWSSCASCGPRGHRCLYTLKEPKPEENNVIRAVHFGLNLRTMETIKIAFEEINKTCTATGESISNEWFRVFDYGTNYCNLHNLVIGTGFDTSSKFVELTSNAVCTQYNMAVCE